jgi:hypothetical protein
MTSKLEVRISFLDVVVFLVWQKEKDEIGQSM